MNADGKQLRTMLRDALAHALKTCPEVPERYERPDFTPPNTLQGRRNLNRGALWVRCFGERLRRWCQDHDPDAVAERSLRVFYKPEPDVPRSSEDRANYREFHLRELLFDFLIARADKVETDDDLTYAWYITEPIWAIESEFDRLERKGMWDFAKLPVTCAPNRLFIGPPRDRDGRKTFVGAGRACLTTGAKNVYIAAVPHPDDWRYRTAQQRAATLANIGVWKLQRGLDKKWAWRRA